MTFVWETMAMRTARLRAPLHPGQSKSHIAAVHRLGKAVQPACVHIPVDIHGGVVDSQLVGLEAGSGELLRGVQGYRAAQAVAKDVPRAGRGHDGADIRDLRGHGVVCGLPCRVAPGTAIVDINCTAFPESLGQRQGPVDLCRKECAADEHHTALS